MTIEQVKQLKVGDKVVCNKSFDDLPQKGWIGKIIYKTDICKISIEWEKKFTEGHDCNRRGKEGQCRFYSSPEFDSFWDNNENQNISVINKYTNNQLEFEF